MNSLLLFFALPIAVIIFSIVFQRILKCPFLVAGIIFSVFLILTFTVFDINFLIATIIYTILSFIVAYLVCIFQNCRCNIRCKENIDCCSNCKNTIDLLTIQSKCGNSSNNGVVLTGNSNGCDCNNPNNLLTISSNCSNGNSNDLLTIQSNSNNNSNSCESNCQCSTCCSEINDNSISVSARVLPNQNNNTGTFSGCYRRRCR